MIQISSLDPDLTKFDVQMVFLDEYSEKQACFDARNALLIIFKRYFL
jgi:hypothetical protein